jgi:repressor LexA
MSVGRQIRKAREAAGLSRRELGRLLGVTPSAIANYENGISHPREEIFVALFGALGVDANYLYNDALALAGAAEGDAERIRRYLALDSHGKKVVNSVLELEYARVAALPDRARGAGERRRAGAPGTGGEEEPE